MYASGYMESLKQHTGGGGRLVLKRHVVGGFALMGFGPAWPQEESVSSLVETSEAMLEDVGEGREDVVSVSSGASSVGKKSCALGK